MSKILITSFLFLFSFSLLAQEYSILKGEKDTTTTKRAIKKQLRLDRRKARQIKNIRPYNALAPTKAAFYSAILPGLGQAYNKKYWKIPLVYGALGTGIGIALWNNQNYNEIRDIYKDRLLGITTDRFFDQENNRALISNDGLIRAQKNFKKQRELSIVITIGLYILNIVDANVTAHLQQYNLNNNLSVTPKLEIDQFNYKPNYGLSMNYQF